MLETKGVSLEGKSKNAIRERTAKATKGTT
jgi:hypothetical protein